jgi:hypothetical protein
VRCEGLKIERRISALTTAGYCSGRFSASLLGGFPPLADDGEAGDTILGFCGINKENFIMVNHE